VFCALEDSGRVLLESELALCIADAYPVSEGHSLVIPRRHVADGMELHQPEWNAVVELLKQRREQLSAQDASISGWAGLLNARGGGLNSGEAAGQTVFHAHWHLIPRRDGDCEEQRGGVREVIAGRQSYWGGDCSPRLQQVLPQPPFMAYWWVNHKQTYRQETDGGYIWSPKANANGGRNVSYDNLTRCERGDVVFSYANAKISQIGLVETAAVTAQKPLEFGTAGDNWNQEGWLVRVN